MGFCRCLFFLRPMGLVVYGLSGYLKISHDRGHVMSLTECKKIWESRVGRHLDWYLSYYACPVLLNPW